MSICVDLAGVETAQIELLVESGRLIIRGARQLPEPPSGCCQIMAMEIDYGPFQREVLLPASIDLAHVTAEQREGLLWIELPIP
jgi:HSP20 family molecular chaperone IbpA